MIDIRSEPMQDETKERVLKWAHTIINAYSEAAKTDEYRRGQVNMAKELIAKMNAKREFEILGIDIPEGVYVINR